MTFQEKWNRLPQWLRVTVYTVLGLAAFGGVGYLGYRLIQIIVGAEQMNVFWGAAGALVLMGMVFGGFRGGRRAEKRRRRSETAD
ncbi:MAG: hypothetical protein IH607_04350 [Firmicutes bacterium]|nr:hypothetical protein [Bacillota bacterium]